MIKEAEVFKIGKLLKPHGIKGEIAFAFDNDIFDKVDCPYLICLIDGIFVPFFVEEYRFKGSETALMKFAGFNSEDKLRRLYNIDVYFPRKYLESEEVEADYSWNYFIGFSIIDVTTGRKIGIISDIDESTINILFIVSDGEIEYLIPAVEDFITDINNQKKILKMELPEGLLE